LPFVTTIGIYFSFFIPESSPSVFGTVVKCLPIWSLALFVSLSGSGNGQQLSTPHRKVFWGLVFSSVGDACLVWPEYFHHGVFAFAIAQLLFISTFEWYKLNLKLGVAFFAYANIIFWFIGKGVFAHHWLVPVTVFTYAPILSGRGWLAASKFANGDRDWRTLWNLLSVMSFIVSDSTLSLDKFHSHIPSHQLIVMVTYYLSQFCVALAVMKSDDSGKKVKSKSK